MNTEARQASLVIDSVAKAMANWTVDQHAELNPQLASRYGPDWRPGWLGHTQSQLYMLAQAVAVRSSDVFIHSARWSVESFRSRGVELSDLAQNLRCMGEVLSAELPAAVAKVAKAYVDAAVEAIGTPPGADDGTEVALEGPHAERSLRYLESILAGDRAGAESVIFAALHEKVPVSEIYERILSPAQERLGRMWHRGEISIADEHFGSATTHAIVSQLRSHFVRRQPRHRSMVATSTPGDLHEIGLRMVADLFEIDGWSVFFLGANTPTPDVVEVLERRKTDVLALSISTGLTLRDAGDLIDAVRGSAAAAETRVLVGGPPFRAVPDLWRELGADGCAQSATEAVDLANRLVAVEQPQ